MIVARWAGVKAGMEDGGFINADEDDEESREGRRAMGRGRE